jgi:hypothetical protein
VLVVARTRQDFAAKERAVAVECGTDVGDGSGDAVA